MTDVKLSLPPSDAATSIQAGADIDAGYLKSVRGGRLTALLARNKAYIPGGVSSINRIIDPSISFVRGQGAYLSDVEGKRYIDNHAGFGPHFLAHNFQLVNQPVNQAAIDALGAGDSLFGAGPSILEGQLAELVCQ